MDQLTSAATGGHEGKVRKPSSCAQSTAPGRSHARQVTWRHGMRVLELGLAVALLVVVMPVLLMAAILVWLTSRGPVLFRQTRIGQNGRPFAMLKLRTMYVSGDDSAERLFNTREILGQVEPHAGSGLYKREDDPRITPVGRWLRRFSIDELPQLINVIRGEMSLVGPRPSLPWEVELFTPEQRRREECRPGITGLWQVSGRNRLSMQEMLDLDVTYVESRSLSLDLSILLRTPRAVLLDRNTR